ncbi:MAG: ABC transporter ATP-binding protein [Magnetococcales bacterium]|nr:ABC transporter ATP-binding protein [Magnetococcales bacterium]
MTPSPLLAAVAIRQLSHCYPGARRTPPRTALRGIDLRIDPGTFFVLTGPNGSGKSTLFRILCGMARPSAGQIAIFGHDLLADPHAARREMGVVFQRPALDRHLTVLENLRIHANLHHLSSALFRQRLERLIAWSGLTNRLDERVETLSGGLARQTELVKVLLHEPRLLLLDEPTAGLDPGGRIAFLDTLQRLQQEKKVTILMTSHLFEEAQRADQVAILRQGRLLAMDAPARLTERLGQEILVVQGEGLEELAQRFGQRAGVEVSLQENELRIRGGDPLEWIRELLTGHRQRIRALAIKQPTLEDFYIQMTGRAPQADEESSP